MTVSHPQDLYRTCTGQHADWVRLQCLQAVEQAERNTLHGILEQFTEGQE